MNYEYLEKLKYAYPFSKGIVERPKLSLTVFILLFILLTKGIFTIKDRFSARIWFDETHPNIIKLDRFERVFGSDESIAIGIHQPSGVFNEKTLSVVRKITESLWQVNSVIRVESLSNTNDIIGNDDEIEIQPYLKDDFQFNKENLKNLKLKTMQDDLIPDLYLSKDSSFAMVFGFLKPFHEGTNTYELVTKETEEIVKKYKGVDGLELFIVGKVPSNNAFREISRSDNKKIVPLMLGFIIILLYLIFRSLYYVVIPLILAITTIGSALGFLGYLGIYYNNLLSAIPGILLAICLADALHILFTFRFFRRKGFESKKSITYALTKNFGPTLLTSVSTAISFFSISYTDIAPIRDLGIIIAMGSFTAWLFSYLFIGAALSLLSKQLDKKIIKVSSSESIVDKKNELFVDLIEKNKGKIVFFFVVATIISGVIAVQNEVNSDPIKYFAKDLKFRKDYDFTASKMSGLKGIELVIDSGRDEGIKDPVFLKKVESYIDFILKNEKITKVKSFINIIKKLNKSFNNGDESFYKLPDSSEAIGEILLFYTMGLPQGMDLNNQISLDNRFIRLNLLWDIEMSKQREQMADWLLEKAKDFDLIADTGGTVPIYNSINRQVVSTFFSSMGMAVLLVSLLIFIIFKDVFLSVFSMFPNVIPLIFGACIMKLMGNFIDIGTSIVYAVCLGIAVDDTIHFVVNYKNNRKLGYEAREAIIHTFQITGKALIYTTLLLVIGFGIFFLSEFLPNRNFGILCAITLLLALLTDIIFLPALFLMIDKKKKV